jgi:hypothetical protein
MWYAVVAVLVLAWFVWWRKRPHHERSSALRSRDGYFGGKQDMSTGYGRETPAPRDHAAAPEKNSGA